MGADVEVLQDIEMTVFRYATVEGGGEFTSARISRGRGRD